MFFDYHETYVKPLRDLLAVSVSPVQYLVDWPTKLAYKIQNNLTRQQTLLEENANLRVQLFLLHAKLQKFIDLQNENTQLHALLRSMPPTSERVKVAQILAVSTDPYIQQVLLNKGSREGVYVGQPVLDASGVFGQVVQVAPYTSRVLLITDALSAVPAQNDRSGIRGIVVGRGKMDKIYLSHMPTTADIKTGDTLVTSGLDEHFPVGYPLGTVEYVNVSAGQEFAKIVITPSAHLNSSRIVLLVWPGERKRNQADIHQFYHGDNTGFQKSPLSTIFKGSLNSIFAGGE